MEAAGIEPASRDISTEASTCVVDSLSLASTAPIDRVYQLGENVFSGQRARRDRGEPDLTTDF